MSIIITGMKMPKHCITCPFMVSRENDDCILQSLEANAHAESWEQLRDGCPLIELPPHGRLIDADAFAAKYIAALPGGIDDLIDKSRAPEFVSRIQALLMDIAEAPAIIPADQVKEDT